MHLVLQRVYYREFMVPLSSATDLHHSESDVNDLLFFTCNRKKPVCFPNPVSIPDVV